ANTGTMTVSGTGAVVMNNTSANTVIIGNGNAGVLNLDGGTFTTARTFTKGAGTATVNFNGGKLQAAASSATFMTGLTAANVKAGGAIIDTNGFNWTIGQILLEGGGGTDGGLVKSGAGTLTLSGVNTFKGATAA